LTALLKTFPELIFTVDTHRTQHLSSISWPN